MKKIIAGIFISWHITSCLYAQQETENSSKKKWKVPFSNELSYLGDAFANLRGGIKQGGGLLGMGNLKIGFDTEKSRLWKGGKFFINGAFIHGKSISEEFVGDFQMISNIDVGNQIYLHELWYRQLLGDLEFTIGLQDMNLDFAASEFGGEFINSSFGMPPIISDDIPTLIFPLTGLGFSAKWFINPLFTWQAVVLDGSQTSLDRNAHYLYWNIKSKDGGLFFTEFHIHTKIKEKKGTYKIGYHYHTFVKELDEPNIHAPVFVRNYGLYFIGDQVVLENEQKNKRATIFSQIALVPKKDHHHNFYVGLGATYSGIFSKKGNDILGVAVARSHLHYVDDRRETTFELFYKMKLTDNISIQPDIQYVIHPSGTGAKLDNALVAIMRLRLNF